MKLQTEKIEEGGMEKHLPVIERPAPSEIEGTESGIKVKVGSTPHPMENNHYVEWIELVADNKIYRQFLNPNDSPEAEFPVKAEKIEAREYCNLHGLWKTR